jgi:hypothetical protein
MTNARMLMRGDSVNDFIELLVKQKSDFQLRCSNYTMQVVVADSKYNYIKEEQSNAAFAAFSKLKHDLGTKKRPNIQAGDVSYFIHNFKEPLFIERVINIDLKSAYANILFNDGLISKPTATYLKGLKKKDRLAAVGMLASKKEVYDFENGEPGKMYEERSDFSPFFFYAVKRTSEIMGELKKICGNSYLFTWVDGIYFLPDPGVKEKCQAFLKGINFPSSCEYLKEFDVNFFKASIKVHFKKDNKLKSFDLPLPDTSFKKAMSKALLLSNNKQKTK